MFSYFKEYFDFKTLLACLVLLILGLLSIYSATFDINNAANFHRQLIWAVVSCIVMIFISFAPLRAIQRLAFSFYFGTLAVLVVILLIGSTVKGSKSWLGMGGLGGQPSELAKIATILAFASYLSNNEVSISNVKHLMIALAIFAAPMMLVLAEPDLGTTIVFFAALVPMLYWVGASNFFLIAIIIPIGVAVGALMGTMQFLIAAAVSAGILYTFRKNRFAAVVTFGITLAVGLSVQIVYEHLHPYQQKRIATFLDPSMDQLGAGYNVLQSKIAIGSGGFFGKGFLKGTQTQLNYIPEQWTDFIFCVPGEEFGFIGSSLVIVLLAAIALHGLKIAHSSKNKFGSIAAVGIAAVFLTHSLINIGMAMGIMPVIGIPLPLLSYGGSSLLTSMMMCGLLMNFYSHRKEY
jgi:rod shape determining protein RodA